MTLDEAIKDREEVAEIAEKLEFRFCAEEHRQLAEWLKELKRQREAWEKAKVEIEEIEKDYGFDKATKYGNKNAKQQNLSYSTMMMYEVANIIDEIKEIIDKYRESEVQK